MNVKKLYTIGDSWTQGYGLRNPKTECYPYLISKKLKCNLENHALPAASNDWMFRKTIQWICSQKDLSDVLVIIGWSIPSRREENGKFYYGGPLEWAKRINAVDDPVSKFISEHLYDAKQITKKLLVNVYSLQEVLKYHKIKYLFYQPWIDILIKDDWYEKNDKPDLSTYQHRNDDVYDRIDKKFVIGPFEDAEKIAFQESRHPNSHEHSIMAEHLYNKIISLVKY